MRNQGTDIFTVKSLPAFNFGYRMRLKEYDLNGIVKDLELILPEYVSDDIETKTILSDEELVIMADSTRIKQAFLNIIKNAVEAMPSGGSLVLATKEVRFADIASGFTGTRLARGPCALLTVSDTGMGMDEITREKIYEPFFTTKQGVDKGLGFPMAFSIIQNHHGSVKVESALGMGTTVNVYLPLLRRELLRISPIPLPSSFASADYYEKYGYLNRSSKAELFL